MRTQLPQFTRRGLRRSRKLHVSIGIYLGRMCFGIADCDCWCWPFKLHCRQPFFDRTIDRSTTSNRKWSENDETEKKKITCVTSRESPLVFEIIKLLVFRSQRKELIDFAFDARNWWIAVRQTKYEKENGSIRCNIVGVAISLRFLSCWLVGAVSVVLRLKQCTHELSASAYDHGA